eukprot:8658636-Alexandrium_andersonii.AAC.1
MCIRDRYRVQYCDLLDYSIPGAQRMAHFPILFGGIRTPPEQPQAVQLPAWVTNVPNWNAKVESKMAVIRNE